jgi:hypothetical protein
MHQVGFITRLHDYLAASVGMLASGTQDRGFKPSRSRRIFYMS